jgi:hypothetical protein
MYVLAISQISRDQFRLPNKKRETQIMHCRGLFELFRKTETNEWDDNT